MIDHIEDFVNTDESCNKFTVYPLSTRRLALGEKIEVVGRLRKQRLRLKYPLIEVRSLRKHR